MKLKFNFKFCMPSSTREQLNSRPNTNLLRPEKTDDFMAGEMRVNEHPFLTTLHIIFVREHNRIAKLLKEYLPSALHQVQKALVKNFQWNQAEMDISAMKCQKWSRKF